MSPNRNNELQKANERIEHLNQVLLGIRNVNQLIVSEEDPHRLISRACANLTETMGYLNAWIALIQEGDSGVTLTASSGFDDQFPLICERLKNGDFPFCMRNALTSDTTILIQNPVLQCPSCPLSARYGGRAGFSRRLVFGGKLYGVIAVSVPANLAQDEEEQSLFAEMAGDLAFALHKLEEAQVQHAREEHITLLCRMLDEAPAAITIHNSKGSFLYANRAACRLHGYDTPEDFMPVNLHNLDVPKSEAQIEERIRKIAETGEARFEVCHLRKDGTAFPLEIIAKTIEWHGQPSILSIAVDITERKKVEEVLRASEQRLQSVFRSAPVGIGVVSNRIFQHVNQRVSEISGYSESELLGRSARLVYPSDEEYEAVGRIKYEQIHRQGTGTVETRWKRKDGAIINVLLSSTLIDPDDMQKGVTFTVMDITQRYILEEQLRQAQKMESVGRLAGGVAHDFNNMLSVILGHVGLILDAVPAGTPLHEDLREIHNAAERSANLTQQLLAFARKQTVSPKVLDLNYTVMNMLKILERLIGENIKLALQLGHEIWQVKVDPSQIDQILANLCVNARDAISDVGCITIKTENCEIDEAYCILNMEAQIGSYVMLAVSDTGCGMSRDVRAHLFEPFFTTKEIGKGTGLGLATVYGIVHQNKGFILIDSEPGKGSTFSIYLPRHTQKEASTPKSAARISVSGNETILLVEDEPSMLKLTRKACERLGYKVIPAAAPGEALQLAREHAGEIHLLLTDVVMPEMNGRDLAKNLLSLYPDLKWLFMSGYTEDVIAHHGVLEEGVQFLQKPFTAAILAEKIRETLDWDT